MDWLPQNVDGCSCKISVDGGSGHMHVNVHDIYFFRFLV